MLTKNHDQLTAEVKAHIAADAVVQGKYWDGTKGCFIGCLAHSCDATVLQDRFGLPLPLVKVCEGIFEALPEDDARAFFAAIPDAVNRNGKDLSRVHWAFLAEELCALPSVPAHIQSVIDPVIAGMNLLASGKKWPKAARAAARAARAARAAYAARAAADAAAHAAGSAAGSTGSTGSTADAAAYATAYAARAADAAVRLRQCDTVLRLIADAA